MSLRTRALAAFIPALLSTLAAAAPVHVIVAQDGSGDFKTIQMAIDHAPAPGPSERLVIAIKPGVYRERLVLPQDRPRTTFLGSDAVRTVITAAMSAKEAGGTFLSSTVDIEGAEFEAEGVTFENTFGVGSQAVAIMIHSDKAVFRNCRFIGWQDTVYAASGRQYYKDCFIEGHVDFIFGNASAVFDDCDIHSRGDGYITAQSRTAPDMNTGFVFINCRLTGENTEKGVYLGRPWRPYSRVVYLNCRMDSIIRPEGWDNWRDAKNESTAFYGELGSMGPGATTEKRAAWSHRLTEAEAKQFSPAVFLRGADGWNPAQDTAKRR